MLDRLEWRRVTAPALHKLLESSYVASDDGSLALDYPESTLRWMLSAPGTCEELQLGLAEPGSRSLVACVCAAPCGLLVDGERREALEVGLLCVHHSWRSLGLTPMLLQELRARASRLGLKCAVYTLASARGAPLLRARCFHRPLRPAALRQSGFWAAAEQGEEGKEARAAEKRAVALPRGLGAPRLRRMRASDVARCLELLEQRARRFAVAPSFSEAEFRHRFLGGAARSFVVDAPARAFVSFMLVPLRTRAHPVLQAQLLGYAAADAGEGEEEGDGGAGAGPRPKALLAAALRAARREGAHVFNALALAEHTPLLLGALGFGEGDALTSVHLLMGGGAAGPTSVPASGVAWLPLQ
jgi:GNAT superfamily N-acetyltransferase